MFREILRIVLTAYDRVRKARGQQVGVLTTSLMAGPISSPNRCCLTPSARSSQRAAVRRIPSVLSTAVLWTCSLARHHCFQIIAATTTTAMSGTDDRDQRPILLSDVFQLLPVHTSDVETSSDILPGHPYTILDRAAAPRCVAAGWGHRYRRSAHGMPGSSHVSKATPWLRQAARPLQGSR